MRKISNFVVAVLLFYAMVAVAEEPVTAAVAVTPGSNSVNEPKIMSGMSVIGNGDETPKSLYIVPWKASDVGDEVTFTSSIASEEWSPVDKHDFIDQLDFYRKSNLN